MSEQNASPEQVEVEQVELTDEGAGGEDAVEDTVVAQDGGSVVVDDLSLAADDADGYATDNDVAAAQPGGSAVDGQGDGEGDGEDEGEAGTSSENPLEVEAEVAADYLEELLDIADLDGDIDTFIEGDRAHVSIVSESKVLVGPDGAVLDALQELTRLAVLTETGDRSRLMLDVAGYREERRQQLLQVASSAVERVRGGDARVALDPMNPFERKIVHDAVAQAGFTSESEGEEPRRRVVVLPAS